MLEFILFCVVIMVIDEAVNKTADVNRMRDELNKAEKCGK
jgi:hypothetical protein